MTWAAMDRARGRIQQLTSNGVSVTLDAVRAGRMRESTHVAGQPAELRRRFWSDGYLLLRGVLDRADVLGIRADYFARLERHDAVHGGGGPAYGTVGHPAYDLVRSPTFDAFTRDARLHELAELLFAAPVELLPRRIVRHFAAHSPQASRAHVDFDYLDQGSDQVVTAWITLGDCPIERGGIVYLEGSQVAEPAQLDALRRYTDRPHDARPVSNDLDRTSAALGGRWLCADFEAGDVVLHTARIVHASLDNVSDVARLSTDLRFQRIGDSADQRWGADWSADDGY